MRQVLTEFIDIKENERFFFLRERDSGLQCVGERGEGNSATHTLSFSLSLLLFVRCVVLVVLLCMSVCCVLCRRKRCLSIGMYVRIFAYRNLI